MTRACAFLRMTSNADISGDDRFSGRTRDITCLSSHRRRDSVRARSTPEGVVSLWGGPLEIDEMSISGTIHPPMGGSWASVSVSSTGRARLTRRDRSRPAAEPDEPAPRPHREGESEAEHVNVDVPPAITRHVRAPSSVAVAPKWSARRGPRRPTGHRHRRVRCSRNPRRSPRRQPMLRWRWQC